MNGRRPTPGFAVWFTGLPASGKTTLARAVQQRLSERGYIVELLDSDELRRQLTPEPTYTPAERDWFYDTIVFLADLLTRSGVNVLIAATGPRRAYRDAARARLPRFAEVYVDCPPQICRERDPKGLWQQAAQGEIERLPGAGAPYEPPPSPEIHVPTASLSASEAADRVLRQLVTLFAI